MEIDKMASKAFMEYSMEVIKQRALPGIEDGCKPIHRRILYIMKDEGCASNKPTRKCAKVVGSVMGRVHPHGDSSIYDALVRLAQPWKMRYPLVEVQGNMGNILGDKSAASRYTECKLTPIGELMTNDVDKHSVPMMLNYSGEEEEPVILTSEFPNALVNPNLGIAVGMSSTTVSHNLNEVCDALIAYIKSQGMLTTSEMLTYIKGPDFPTGGTIINGEDIPTIYATGRGSIKLRSKYNVTTVAGKTHIIITEVPYLISIEDKIIDKVKHMVIEDGYAGIEHIQNNTGKDGFSIDIVCAKNANVNKVIKDLCENTGFQTTISINNTVLVNGIPKFLSFIQMISNYIAFRHKVLTNIAIFDKQKAENKLHILDGLLIALRDIDAVIAIIKSSISKDDARKKLIAKYTFSLEQVNAILDMKLSRLTSMETKDIEIEQASLQKAIIEFLAIIFNKGGKRDELLISQILSIKKKFGDNRRTNILVSCNSCDSIDRPVTNIINLVMNDNSILPLSMVDKFVLDKKSKQTIKFGYISKNIGNSYVFSESGKMYKVDNNVLDANNVASLGLDDNLVCGIGELNKQYLITVSVNGIIKKTNIVEYINMKNTLQAVKIRDTDKLYFAGCCDDTDYLYLLGVNGNLSKIKVSDISASSRVTIGTKGMSCAILSAAIIGDNELLFTSTKDNKAKYTVNEDFNITVKGGNGQVITEDTVLIAPMRQTLCIVEKNAKGILYNKDSLSVKSKTAIGAKISNEQIIKVIN